MWVDYKQSIGHFALGWARSCGGEGSLSGFILKVLFLYVGVGCLPLSCAPLEGDWSAATCTVLCSGTAVVYVTMGRGQRAWGTQPLWRFSPEVAHSSIPL